MASQNKKSKVDKRKHWGRGRNFLKSNNGHRLRRISFFNSSDRQKLKKVDND